MRARCPGFPVGVTTAAWIEPDVSRRLAMLHSWTVLPAFASVNLSEEGALEVIDLLNALGVGVEAGVWTTDDAHMLVENGTRRCVRARARGGGCGLPIQMTPCAWGPRLTSSWMTVSPRRANSTTGAGLATWSVMAAAIENGHDVRVGLEDTLVLGDRSLALNNAVLVSSARSMAVAAGRWIESGEQG